MSDCAGPGCTHPSHGHVTMRRIVAGTAATDIRPPPSARPVPPWTDPRTFDGWEAEVGRLVDRAAHLDAQADAAGGAIASAARKMASRLRAKALLLSREAQAVTGRKAP